MAIINLRIHKGFDRENRSGCNFTPSVTIQDQILYNFPNFYHHKTKTVNAKIMKICNQAKIKVLNVNLGSEISYHASC